MLFKPKDNSKESAIAIGKAKEVIGEILDKKNSNQINPLFLKNRTLTISCLNIEAAKELQEKQQEIVLKINEKLGKNEVDRLRYLL